jgi:hypothetical protein
MYVLLRRSDRHLVSRLSGEDAVGGCFTQHASSSDAASMCTPAL